MVSGYIINKILLGGKNDFCIKAKKDNSGEFYYDVYEKEENGEMIFYLKILCNDKNKFYDSLITYLIEYYRMCELLQYVGIRSDDMRGNELLLFFYCGAKISIYDEDNLNVFLKIKSYLDTSLSWFQKVNKKETINSWNSNHCLSVKNDVCLRKIML